MPITVEVLEPYIYRSCWMDYVSIEDIRAAVLRRMELADQDNASHYVSIVDVSHAGSIPVNARALQETMETDPRVIVTIIVGATLPARILVENLTRATRLKMEFAYSTEDSLKRARAVLEERDRGIS
jgi:hypothetical protein